MTERYRTVYRGGQAEITEKKSRFIAELCYAPDEKSAMAFVEEKRKRYWNARHNCWAYVLGERQETVRCSDDGEPGGTAGRPMLEVLLGAGLSNAVVVVTRYFGGTLLGTGGLVRAYSKAVQEGIKASTVIERQWGVLLEIRTDYTGDGRIRYLLEQSHLVLRDVRYEADVTMTVVLPASQTTKLEKAITEATNGKAVMIRREELPFAVLDRKVLVGDELVYRESLT